MTTTPTTTTQLPTLYKRNSNGSLNQWTITVADATITTTYGQVGGVMQTTSDTITEGKNLGRSNATTPQQQAQLEAAAQHEKKRKSGYVADLATAQQGGTDDIIEGGVPPMLAKVWEDRADKITFPVAVQPKLDGHRCIAVVDVTSWTVEEGRVFAVNAQLWSRTRKCILSMPHVIDELITSCMFWSRKLGVTGLAVFSQSTPRPMLGSGKDATTYRIVLDGELYQHSYRDRFEQLTSLIRPDEPRPGHEVVEYHVYDIVSQQPFLDRFRALEHTFDAAKHIRLVETHIAGNVDQLMSHYDYFRKAGYEGAMARQLHLPYEHKRSDQLLKLKDFVDSEFKIVGVEEGRGKLRGHVGAFVCEVPVGDAMTTCAVKLAGDTSVLAQAWQQPDKWIGKMLTVKYQGRTATGSLRFPVGLRLRDE